MGLHPHGPFEQYSSASSAGSNKFADFSFKRSLRAVQLAMDLSMCAYKSETMCGSQCEAHLLLCLNEPTKSMNIRIDMCIFSTPADQPCVSTRPTKNFSKDLIKQMLTRDRQLRPTAQRLASHEVLGMATTSSRMRQVICDAPGRWEMDGWML